MRNITLATAFMLLVTGAGPALAQSAVEVFSELSKVVKPGDVVIVHDEAGQRVKGRITTLSDASLQLMFGIDGREATFAAGRVSRVSRVDSRLNGFLIGAVIGVAGGIWSASFIDMLFENEASNADWAYPVFGGIMGLAGGGLGFAIDGAIDGQQQVFARRGTPSAGVRVGPIVGPNAAGGRVSIRF